MEGSFVFLSNLFWIRNYGILIESERLRVSREQYNVFRVIILIFVAAFEAIKS